MKPSSILLLTAAGLATALPAHPNAARSEIQDAPVARSFFERAVDVFFARDLVPLNSNTAAPAAGADAAAADAAAKKGAAATTSADKKKGAAATTTAAAAAAATTTSAAGANNAAAPPAATVPPPAATAAPPAAAPPPPPAAGNGTAAADGKGKGKGKGQDQGKGKGKDQGKGKGKGKGGNNNNNSLGDAITGALSQLGLDGVLNVGSINKLNGGQQIQLLSQIVALQTLADLQMVTSKQVAVALNQGFKSNGLNVVINA